MTLLGFAPESSPSPPSKGENTQEKREIFSRKELVKLFSFERVNKSSAVFDMNKLNWMNSEYIRMADEALIVQSLKSLKSPKVEKYGEDYLISVIRLMKERVSTINDFVESGTYFFEDPEKYDEKGLEKYWDTEAKELIREYLKEIEPQGSREAEEIEKHLREFAEKKGVKAAKLIHPLRLALTGITVSPGIFEVMEVLGQETVIRRIRKFTLPLRHSGH